MERQDTLIKSIKVAASKLKDSKLKRLNIILPALQHITDTIGMKSADEAMMFVAIFDRYCEERQADMSDLASYFGCSTLEIMEYQPCLTSMVRNGILIHADEDEFRLQKMSYTISDLLFESIINGQPIIHKRSDEKEYNHFDFIIASHKIVKAARETSSHGHSHTPLRQPRYRQDRKCHADSPANRT